MRTPEEEQIYKLNRKIRKYQELQDDSMAYIAKLVRHRRVLFRVLKDLEPLFDYAPQGYEEECKAASQALIQVEKYMNKMKGPYND